MVLDDSFVNTDLHRLPLLLDLLMKRDAEMQFDQTFSKVWPAKHRQGELSGGRR